MNLALRLAVVPGTQAPVGDVLGLYAVEVLACPVKLSELTVKAHFITALNRLTDMAMGSAWANHRDHFDRAGARIVPTRVPLDRSGIYPLGAVDVPSGLYCHVRLTLTRLPSVERPIALPALETSVRLSRPGALAPLAVGYVVPLELPFLKPWQAQHGQAELTMTLDPSSANAVLADASLSEGALVRLVSARWAATSQLRVTEGR